MLERVRGTAGDGFLAPGQLDKNSSQQPAATRWSFLRDVVVFQAKLVVDGLRDLLLVPLSLVAALADLLSDPQRPGRRFYEIVAWGRQSERWIDLFEAARMRHPEMFADEPADAAGLNELVAQVETRVREQYERGGLTAQAKRAIDGALDGLGQIAGARERGAGEAQDPSRAGEPCGRGDDKPGPSQ